MRHTLSLALLAALTLGASATLAADKAATDTPAIADKDFHLPPLPADAHITQSATVDGKTLKYTVTVGSLPVRNEQGEITGEVVFTAYTLPGKDRPVTFALNGGPGASSVYLNLGAIGPKRVNSGVAGANPSGEGTPPNSIACRTEPPRISKNSSRLVQLMHRKRNRSSNGTDGSCACASTRKLKSSCESSRLAYSVGSRSEGGACSAFMGGPREGLRADARARR